MTAPNHIVGGIAITGISLSFWDINIFSNPVFLSLCIFASLLPDIDHTKSLIGKLFFPLAKYLDKNYGHRTITHSLTFLIPLLLVIIFLELNIINPYFERIGTSFSLIFFFAFLSHLILDMLTVQGIPLFYPFLRNPCVIPANPTLRFKSGNIKSEAIALFIFTFVLFSSYDLFKNGFWTTYNRSFGTIKHVYREFKASEKVIQVEYEYLLNNEKQSGKALVIDATEKTLFLWQNNASERKFFKIDSKNAQTKKISVKPSKTIFDYKIKEIDFYNLSAQEINQKLKDKIVSGQIKCSHNFSINNNKAVAKKTTIDKLFSPVFEGIIEGDFKDKLRDKLDLKIAKLEEIKKHNFEEYNKLYTLEKQLKKSLNSLETTTDIYTRNSLEKTIIQLKKDILGYNPNTRDTTIILREIELLKKDLAKQEVIVFSGTIKIFDIPLNQNNIASK
jgi:membrane-bound metal-dependent hydrolase YbcI (DUF457 family)